MTRRLAELVLFPVCFATVAMRLALFAVLRPLLRSRRDAAPGTFDLLVVSHVEWHHAWQRNQHTMSRLARERRVLYAYPVKVKATRNYWRHVGLGTWRDQSGVWLHYPLVVPGGRASRLVARFNAWWVERQLRCAVRRAGIARPVLWYYFPDQVELAYRLDTRAIAYDIQDNYAHFPWASPDLPAREAALIDRADIVFTGTHRLYERVADRARRAKFIGCGVDFDYFHSARDDDAPPAPESVLDIPHPILGYFGSIDERIDVETILELARRRPEWHFLLLGPLSEDLRAQNIQWPENVHLPGHIRYDALVAHAQVFDVCLMPFRLTELTRDINPTKTLEYFALERPVVSARLPDMMRFYSDVIDFAETPDEWEAAIDRALRPDADRIVRALDYARERSWESTTREFAEAIRAVVEREDRP